MGKSQQQPARGILTGLDVVVMGLLTAAALLVRLWDLGRHSIWVDEGATVDFAIAPSAIFWSDILLFEPNPPGYYLFMRFWVQAFGISDFAIRFPSALISALAIVPLYAFAARNFGRETAAAASLLLVVSAIQVEYAQEARAYAFLTFFFLVALWSVDKILDDETIRSCASRRAVSVSLILSCVGLGYFHFTGLLIIAAIFVYQLTAVLIRKDVACDTAMPIFRNAAFIIILLSPVIAVAIYQVSLPVSGVDWIPSLTPIEAFAKFRQAWGHSFLMHAGPWIYRTTDVVLVIAGFAALVRAIRARNAAAIAMMSAVVFVILIFLLVSEFKAILLPRVLIFAAPVVLLIVVYGASSGPSRIGTVLVLMIILALQVFNLKYYNELPAKEDWREMITSAHGDYKPGTAIVHIGAGKDGVFLGGGPVMVKKYWPGSPPYYQFFATDLPSRLDAFVLNSYVNVERMNPDEICLALRSFSYVMIFSRREVRILESVRHGLTSRGSEQMTRMTLGRLVYEYWSGPTCLD